MLGGSSYSLLGLPFLDWTIRSRAYAGVDLMYMQEAAIRTAVHAHTQVILGDASRQRTRDAVTCKF